MHTWPLWCVLDVVTCDFDLLAERISILPAFLSTRLLTLLYERHERLRHSLFQGLPLSEPQS